jgi:hypothetical protein
MADYAPRPDYAPVEPSAAFLSYDDSVEQVSADETETFEAMLASMHRLHERTYRKFGEAVRVSHVVPVAPAQRALDGTSMDLDDPNALRTATVGYLRDHDAEFEIRA